MSKNSVSIIDAFSSINAPRSDTSDYPLTEIIFVALCAVLSGCDDWTTISFWGKNRLPWLRLFFDFKNGVPSHDTFGRVFAAIKSSCFEECFISWIRKICPNLESKALAIDGKTIYRSHDRYLGKKAIHMVSAYFTEYGLCLGQEATKGKGYEIKGMLDLIDSLALKKCIVRIDAMGTQTSIAKKIVDKQSDYILQVKKNQSNLHETISEFFETAEKLNYVGLESSTFETACKDHGRVEQRRSVLISDLSWMDKSVKKPWAKLGGIGMVKKIGMVKRMKAIKGKKVTSDHFL